jgi:hypothetical protein
MLMAFAIIVVHIMQMANGWHTLRRLNNASVEALLVIAVAEQMLH